MSSAPEFSEKELVGGEAALEEGARSGAEQPPYGAGVGRWQQHRVAKEC